MLLKVVNHPANSGGLQQWYRQRWSPRGRPWRRGRPRGHIFKSLALASKPQVLGLEALGPRKLLCPWLEESTIF